MLKSSLLAVGAGYAAYRFRTVSLLLMVAVVAFYQIVGTLGEWMMKGSLYAAMQDFRIGLPGMAVQIVGGWAFVKYLLRR